MSFDEDNNEHSASDNSANTEKKAKTFFGLELGDGVVYTIVIILTLIFIRQVVVVIQALN
ncbi:MAG: hypothetical protein RLO18_22500 [Gimesia chilikensis]